MFEDLVKHVTNQRSEADRLRRQLQTATSTIVLQNASISTRIQEALEEEKRQSAEDRQKLMTQITGLINAHTEAQETRIADRAAQVQKSMAESSESLEGAVSQYAQDMDGWDSREGQLLEDVKKSRDQLKTKLKDDWTAADDRSTSIQNTAKSVHAETVRVVDEQIEDLDAQMEALDDFVTRAKSENATHHEAHSQSVKAVSTTVEQSFGNISGHFKTTFDRVKNLGEEMELDVNDLNDGLEPLDTQLCQPLANLREDIATTALQEYQPTGETPQKVVYQYPTSLPRTKRRSLLSTKIDEDSTVVEVKEETDKDNTLVFADLDSSKSNISPSRPSTASTTATATSVDKIAPLNMTSLREVNPNVTGNLTTGNINFDHRASNTSAPADLTMPLFKRSTRTTRGAKKQSADGVGEGRENVPLTTFSENAARRKSPRLN
jgi:kinesin family protein 11